MDGSIPDYRIGLKLRDLGGMGGVGCVQIRLQGVATVLCKRLSPIPRIVKHLPVSIHYIICIVIHIFCARSDHDLKPVKKIFFLHWIDAGIRSSARITVKGLSIMTIGIL